jgi:hypothetical protein
LLRSILRLRCAAFCAAYCTVEVVVGRLRLVLQTDLRIVPHPLRNHVNRERFEQFRFTGTSQVVEKARPRFQAGAIHNPLELRSQVAPVRPLDFSRYFPPTTCSWPGIDCWKAS